ncbi:GNAT family N-acetyltransferase [Dongia sedimenti]|uniref:GNAT family N-acetyltransferase n=1 Tax=Dongia sedimenti TaxID=3064282 RepID=A0ABU0YU29_9PROT|nr:GNAT family N-acetyltransferase [Rhodospirillaceae bacterium R-7]
MPDAIAPELRRAGPADAEAIAALTREAYAKWVPIIGRAPKPMTADYDLAVRAHLIDLLYADGVLAALIECIPADDHLLIENLAVGPAHQGRGFGRHMLAHGEALARALGFNEVRLYTNKLFAENIAFYQKHGYRLDGETPFKDGFVVHMSRRL